MTVKNTLLFIIFLMLAGSVESATKKIHVWRDKNGVLVFSDTPNPNPNADSKEISLNDDVVTVKSQKPTILNKSDKPKKKLINYKIEIMTPGNEATVRDNTGSLHVTSRVIPRFKTGYKIQLLMDGAIIHEPQASTIFALQNVDRGAHTIQVALLDEKGKRVASSESVTFYMHRARVGGF